jgi:hypothetical protein
MLEKSVIEERINNAKERGRLREMMIDFYEENQYAKTEYFKQWGFKDIDLLPFFNSRLVRYVADSLSRVYSTFPDRYLVNTRQKEIADDGIQKFFEENPIANLTVKWSERYFNLLGNVLVRFSYDVERKKLYPYIDTDYIPVFPADENGVVLNNLYPVGYHIVMPQDENSKDLQDMIFLFISDTQYFFHDEHGEVWFDPAYPDGRNPYGIMPILDFSIITPSSYWSNGLRSIVELCRMWIVGMLNTSYGQHFQSFDQAWTKGLRSEALPKDKDGNPVLQNSPFTAWDLGDEGEAGLLKPDPKLVESVEMFRGWLNVELFFYGLRAEFRETGNPMSGFAIVVANRQLFEKRRADLSDIFILQEDQLFKVIRAMNDFHRWGYNIPSTSTMITSFAEPETIVEPMEQREQWTFEWENGLARREDYLLKKNKDMKPEEAEQIIKENLEKQKTFKEMFQEFEEQNAPFGFGAGGE